MPVTLTKTSAKKEKNLVLLDAHAIIHRAYHALPNFTSRAGESTGGLYGLTAMLIRLLDELKPDAVVAAYDRPETTFRKAVYEGYKATRPKTEPALVSQLDRSREVFSAFGIPILDSPGFEADDVIATAAEKAERWPGWRVVIASGDMDTLQLVRGKKITVYTLSRGITDTVLYDEERVKQRYGFSPELLPDFKGLAGDPSDNIPGVKGIGEKTASRLISNFGALEKIFAALKDSPETVTKIGLSLRQRSLLTSGEDEAFFSRALATVRRDVPICLEPPESSWREAFEPSAAENLCAKFEFRSLLPRLTKLAGANLKGAGEPDKNDSSNYDPELVDKLTVAVWLLNSQITRPTVIDILQTAKTKTIEEAKVIIDKQLKKNGLEKVYQDIELPLIPIIKRAEERGILIDRPYLKSLSKKYHQELLRLEKEIFKQTGFTFNVSSPKQLAEALFDRLGLGATIRLKKTPGGVRSTRETELLKLKDSHPVVSAVLGYRELKKMLTTYVDNLPDLADKDGRLHTSLNQTGTTTGRMSSSNPNLQNIPASIGLGDEIRRAFIATSDFCWATFDYSQIEMRVLAALANDQGLKKIFQEGKDIHAAVAARMFGVAEDKVSRDMRRAAKVINFGIIYGMGVNALRQSLGGSRAEAERFYDNYYKTFPAVRRYFDAVPALALARGYTETHFGRRRYFPSLRSPLPYIRAAAERQAYNAPLQGTAADIVKLAMIKIDKLIDQADKRPDCHLLLQVHDELIYEIKNDAAAELIPKIKEAMETVIDWPVPLLVNSGRGFNWAETK